MNRRTYRICLVMLIMAAIVSGVFYYRFMHKKENLPKEGTFVRESLMERECI